MTPRGQWTALSPRLALSECWETGERPPSSAPQRWGCRRGGVGRGQPPGWLFILDVTV